MKQGLENALHAIDKMIQRSEEAQQKFKQGTSQHTLLANRIASLYIASSLLRDELQGAVSPTRTKEELENARAPLESLISKSEKVQQKLSPESWQYTMTTNNLLALRLALTLLQKEIDAFPASNQ